MKNDDDANNRKQDQQQQPPPLPTTQQSNLSQHQTQNLLSPLISIEAATSNTTTATAIVSSSDNKIHNPNLLNQNTNNYYSPTISALVRGLHDTGIRDPNHLQLPLFETDNEEEDEEETEKQRKKQNSETENSNDNKKANDPQLEEHNNDHEEHDNDHQLQKQTTLKRKSHSVINILHHTIIPHHTLHNNSPHKTELTADLTSPHEHQSPPHHHHHHHLFHLHPSLPRFVVNLADDLSDNNNGDGAHKMLESHAPPSPGGARRLSQFNFNLRRFSHAHATVLFETFFYYFFYFSVEFLTPAVDLVNVRVF